MTLLTPRGVSFKIKFGRQENNPSYRNKINIPEKVKDAHRHHTRDNVANNYLAHNARVLGHISTDAHAALTLCSRQRCETKPTARHFLFFFYRSFERREEKDANARRTPPPWKRGSLPVGTGCMLGKTAYRQMIGHSPV